MHLIFERYKGRFRSNCNILALAWMPYYQESKFRQSLFDYHQRQLSSLAARSPANFFSGNAQHESVPPNESGESRPAINPSSQSGSSSAGTSDNRANNSFVNDQSNQNGSANVQLDGAAECDFPNMRLAEQYKRHVLAKNKPKSPSSGTINLPQTGHEIPMDLASINDELDRRYGRMPEFGWLAIANIGKIVGVTLTSTVPPPVEIDGRKETPCQTNSTTDDDDLIRLDGGLDGEANNQNNGLANCANEEARDANSNLLNAKKSSDYELVRPDRKCVRANYNLRGHLDEIILVKWNELYQKLATVDIKGNVLIWCKVNEKFTIQTPFYNRSKSVADFKWSNDGKTALICYTDSFILVGSSSSQRHWHSMLNLDDYHITCASWAPNDDQLLLGVSNGNVVVIDLPRSELTELVVGSANIRTMCWSSCDLNLRNLANQQEGQQDGLDRASRTQSPPQQTTNKFSAIVSQRRLSRDCSVFSRYAVCSQGPSNVNLTPSAVGSSSRTRPGGLAGSAQTDSGRDFSHRDNRHKNILAIDFADNTIRLFDGGLEDPKPRNIEVKLESYLMAWSSSGKVLAVAGFNIHTSAPSIGCLRCRYANYVKFYNQLGALIVNMRLSFSRYPITALAWAHDDQRLFVATGPRLHCARVYYGVPKLSLLAMSCVHRNASYPNKLAMVHNLMQQLKWPNLKPVNEFKGENLLNWQSFNCALNLKQLFEPTQRQINSSEEASRLMSQSSDSGGGGGVQYSMSSSSSSSEAERRLALDTAILKNNLNIAYLRLPARLKVAVDELFQQTLKPPFDEHFDLDDVVWHVPKSKQRLYCTLICYTHELVDLGCGATMGHQYKTHELNELRKSTSSTSASSTGDLSQASDQYKIFVLYIEHQGSLIPILKARRVGLVKPEFVIFDPNERASKHPFRRQKVSDLSANPARFAKPPSADPGQLFRELPPPRLDACAILHAATANQHFGELEQAKTATRLDVDQLRNGIMANVGAAVVRGGGVKKPAGERSAQDVRRAAVERYRALASRQNQDDPSSGFLDPLISTGSNKRSPSNLRTLPEAHELVRVRSNVWGTKIKLITVGNRMIARRAHLGSLTYKASILHLQPRRIFLNLRDMTNYCVFCSLFHHTRAPSRSNRHPASCAAPKSSFSNDNNNNLVSLMDLPISATSLQSSPMFGGKKAGAKRQETRRSSTKPHRDEGDEDKIILPFGDAIRIAPKLESNQRYKLTNTGNSSASPSSSSLAASHRHKRTASGNIAGQRAREMDQSFLMPGTSKSNLSAASQAIVVAKADHTNDDDDDDDDDDDVLTLTLDQGDQVRVEMSAGKDEKPPAAAGRDDKLDQFLEANRTLKSIQSITKMIVDLSSRAKEEVDRVDALATGTSQLKESLNFRQHQQQQLESPIKLLRISSGEHEKVRSPTRYIPPETPVHRPRRMASASGGRPRQSSGDQEYAEIGRTQSVSSTPLRAHRRNPPSVQGRTDGLAHELPHLQADVPLPPPPPSIPFRRKVSSSAKRFFDGSLRSLTGTSGHSTADERDDSEDCEPLMSRRHQSRRRRRPVHGQALDSGRNLNRNQSQPCTPSRSFGPISRDPRVDLSNLGAQLYHRIRNSMPRDLNVGERSASLNGRDGSQQAAQSCIKKSRWILHQSRPRGRAAGYATDSEMVASSSSSSSSSSLSLSSSGSSSDEGSGRGQRRQDEPRFMRHVERLRSLGRKTARSLTDLARINLNETAGKNHESLRDQSVDMGTSRPTSSTARQQQQQQQRRRRRHGRGRGHNREPLCTDTNCCCNKRFRLNNRPPVWNELSQVYQLDFGGRVTQESAKNLQIDFNGDLALQFGRLDRCTYTLDYKHPFNAVQAMAIALASLTQRLK